MTRLAPGGSSGVLAGALRRLRPASVLRRGIKASGTWLLRECYSPGCNTLAGTEVPRFCKDAGVMVISDPS